MRVANVAGALLLGRRRLNPRWIAKHYDSQNMQLFALDELYNVYTPGVYEADDDTLEQGAERKLALAFDALGLRAGDSLLDVGCGWGGFLRFCARRGVDATGISLSRHQLEFARQRLEEDGLSATTRYQDFFSYQPERRFDAISLMGSIEDLSSYREVLRRLRAWLAPGGRVYLDFAGRDRPWGIASFVTKHVWPGAFRMVYLPAFTRALARTHFDVVEMHSDRSNYHRWARLGLERWTERRDAVLAAADERTWRLMHVLTAGTAYVMGPRSTWATAYRVVLESRAAPQRRTPGTRREAAYGPAGATARDAAIPG
jgi:cyclopropane-fatty-acyl-phospholipid synthase